MRIREILFHNFRSFRGEKRISFVDPLTDAVRPITVIAGTNGTGKTTILDAIEALLAFTLDPHKPIDLIKEAQQDSLICLTLEFSPAELRQLEGAPTVKAGKSQLLRIAVGRWEFLPEDIKKEPACLFGRLTEPREESGRRRKARTFPGERVASELQETVALMIHEQAELWGGLIYFPYDRRLRMTKGGPIEPPPPKREWMDFSFLIL